MNVIKHANRTPRSLTPFILFTVFLNIFSIGVYSPLMPALTKPYGGTAFDIGLLYATLSLAAFLSSPGLGALSDRYGRRPIVLLSLFGAGIGQLIFGIGGALWVLFAGWIVVGLTDSYGPTAFSYVADTTEPRTRTRAFAFLRAAMGLGFIIGPLVSRVFSPISPTAPVFVLVALLLVDLVWGYFTMAESLPKGKRTSQLKFRQLNSITQLFDTLRISHLRWLLISLLLLTMTTVVLVSNLPIMMSDRFGWSPDRIAPVFAVYGVTEVFVQGLILPRLLSIFSEVRLAIGGALIVGFAFVLLGLLPTTGAVPLLYTAMVLIGISLAVVETSLIGLMSNTVGKSDQGRIQGSISAVQALARIIGPLWAGLLYQTVGTAMPYWIGVAQMLVGGFVVVLALPKLRSLESRKPVIASYCQERIDS